MAPLQQHDGAGSWWSAPMPHVHPYLEALLSVPGTANGECAHSLHEHCPQLQEVIVLWVFHLDDTPWVEAPSDLLAFGFNQLIGPNHREWDTGLERYTQGSRLTLGRTPSFH